MSDQTFALFNDPRMICAYTDAQFTEWEARLRQELVTGMAQVSAVVGFALADIARRWGDKSPKYKRHCDAYREITNVEQRTLARWRAKAEAAYFHPDTMSGSIVAKPQDAISEISAGAVPESAVQDDAPAEPSSGPTAAEPSQATAADKADESGEPEEFSASSGSAASQDSQDSQDVAGAPVSAVPAAPAAPSRQGPIRGGLPGSVPGSAGSTPASGDDRAQAPVATPFPPGKADRSRSQTAAVPAPSASVRDWTVSRVEILLAEVAQIPSALLVNADRFLLAKARHKLNGEPTPGASNGEVETFFKREAGKR